MRVQTYKIPGLAVVLFVFLSFLPFPAKAATTISGIISTDTVWTAANSPYIVNGTLTIPTGITLIIEQGVVVKFIHLQSKMNVYGAMQVNGTNDNKVYFTSYKDDEVGGDTNADGSASLPLPKDWRQVIIYPGANVNFNYSIIRYGGNTASVCPDYTCSGALNNKGNLDFSNSQIYQTDKYGIYQSEGLTTADAAVFDGQSQAGIYVSSGSLSVSGSTFSNQDHTGIIMLGDSNFDLNNNIFQNNLRDVYIDARVNFTHSNNNSQGGTLAGFNIGGISRINSVWESDNMPYIVNGNLIVQEDSALTINSGVIIKFAHNQSYLDVRGILSVNGEEEKKVYFTSLKDDEAGGDTNGDGNITLPAEKDWRRILVNPGAIANINNAIIRYGGYIQFNCPYYTCYGAVNNRGNLNLINSEITKNGNYGIYQTDGISIIDTSSISEHSRGIYVTTESDNLTIHNSSIFNNTGYGILNYSSNTVDATRNWWGDPTGPYHYALNTGGLGNAVSDGVNFSPWLNYDPSVEQMPTIENLEQFRLIEEVELTEGESTANNVIILKALLTDPNEDMVKMQVELKKYSQNFDGQNLLETELVPSGTITMVTFTGLVEESYKWRARTVNENGFTSEWQEFGAQGNVDFSIVPLGQAAADLAKKLANHPEAYLWGGKGWSFNQQEFISASVILSGYDYWNPDLQGYDTGIGLDCSGLVVWSFDRSNNPFLSRYNNVILAEGSNSQYHDNSEAINESDLQSGDLLFFGYYDQNKNVTTTTHVAMYVGNNGSYDVVHASSPQLGIRTAWKDSLKTEGNFLKTFGFRRIILNTELSLIKGYIQVGSPVDLVVRDPNDFIISQELYTQSDSEYSHEILGELYYANDGMGSDGRPKDMVYWTKNKVGNFNIQVIPESDILLTDTYSLEFHAGDQVIMLAKDLPISEIPEKGYGVSVSDMGVIEEFLPVDINIKPESEDNTINLGSNGSVSVAIFGSDMLNVRDIDWGSVRLASASIKLKGNGDAIIKYEDLNGDGYDDVIIHILTDAFQLTENDVKAYLEGQLINGNLIKGSDLIHVVP